MGLCEDILNGYNSGCENNQRRFVQKIVLLNKSDILEYKILKSRLDINGGLNIDHSIYFRLKDGKKGISVTNIHNGYNVNGTWDFSENDYSQNYTHSIKFITTGYNDSLAYFLSVINTALYFATLCMSDGTVLVFGFDNGLHSSSYKVDLQGANGVTQITLQTGKNEEEYNAPFIYQSGNIAQNDFDNLFADLPPIQVGEFSDDFNNDYKV